MKSYDPNIQYGIHTIEITLQLWEYVGHITRKIGGNCKGIDVLDFDFECEDGDCLDSDCNLKFNEEYNYFSATLKDSEGNTMEVEESVHDFNKMIVKVEIIDFQKDEDE